MARKSTPTTTGSPRDRILEMRRVRAEEIQPNPKNWREHPDSQRLALRGLLDQVGIADALIAYTSERADGALVLIDGHLRQDESPETEWPVLVLDLDDAEADILLASLDPLAGLATTNTEVLEDLLSGIETSNAGLDAFLAELAKEAGIQPPDFEPVSFDEQGKLDQKKTATCPECGHEFSP